MSLRPFSPSPSVPTLQKEKISNSDDEIAAGLGRKPYRADGVEWVPGGVPPAPNPSTHPANKTLARQSV